MFQVIDMHCDTIPALQWKEKQEHLADADLQINLDKLEKGGSLCQCFSLFTFLKIGTFFAKGSLGQKIK